MFISNHLSGPGAREEHHLIPSHHDGLTIFLRHLAPADRVHGNPKVVLYAHGATFPSALSVAHRFDGRSWADELAGAGYDVWALDFHGYGRSDAYPGMAEPPGRHAPLGRAPDAAAQIERAVRFIVAHHAISSVSIIAHSWGTIAAGLFAGRHPELVDRLVFFGPIARRAQDGVPPVLPAWLPVSVDAQRKRFTEDVPPGEALVLDPQHFQDWAQHYLATDPRSGTREPPSVATPAGPASDIIAAHHGNLAYDPSLVRAPVAIIRGEWDSLATDADARWLWDALKASPQKRDVKISRATHLMHLEVGRQALYRESLAFLDGAPPGCAPGVPA